MYLYCIHINNNNNSKKPKYNSILLKLIESSYGQK